MMINLERFKDGLAHMRAESQRINDESSRRDIKRKIITCIHYKMPELERRLRRQLRALDGDSQPLNHNG